MNVLSAGDAQIGKTVDYVDCTRCGVRTRGFFLDEESIDETMNDDDMLALELAAGREAVEAWNMRWV